MSMSTDNPAIESTDVPSTEELLKDDELVEPVIPDEDTPEPIPLEDKPKETIDDDGEEKEEPIDELKELEEDLDKEEKVNEDIKDEEIEELIAPVRRAEILAKYPKLFKDFPYLEHAYFRNRQFTETFATPKEAQIARQKADALDSFERLLLNGDTETILKTVKHLDENAFHKIVDNYLITLGKVDPNSASHVTGNVIKYTVRAMVNEAQRSGDESLKAAASLLNQFIFGTSEIREPSNLVKENPKEDPRLKEVQQKEYDLFQRQYQDSVQNIGTKVENRVKATIEANIDTKNTMTEYVRAKATEDVLKQVNDSIKSDRQFQILKDRLWKRAVDNGFSKESLQSIENAFISKAKTLLPAVIKKARNEALRGMGKKPANDSNENPVRRANMSGPKVSDKSKEIPRNMSTLDIFNQD